MSGCLPFPPISRVPRDPKFIGTNFQLNKRKKTCFKLMSTVVQLYNKEKEYSYKTLIQNY